MTPREALERLIERGWQPAKIALAIQVNRSTISRLRQGITEPTYTVGAAILQLWRKGRRPPLVKRKTPRKVTPV